MTILMLFFCSGATALVYEVIWSKYLTLLFGSTVQAQTVVLAVFMGGLALGNRIFGRRADRSPQPLALYGRLEVAVGLYAFFFFEINKIADWIFAALGAGLVNHSGWLLALKGLLSAALLLGPTMLMGGTLPVLAAWLQKNTRDAGRRSARFYSVNSLGAVCGAGLAGFFLVTWIGLPMTLRMTAIVNVLVGFVAIGIARFQNEQPTAAPAAAPVPVPVPVSAPAAAATFRWGCLLVALTGAVSMGLEVLSSRCLSLIFGASLQAFAIVLMAFILGIGLGSAAIASPRRKNWPKELTTIALVLGAATWIGILVFKIEDLLEMYRYARSGLQSSTSGYNFYLLMTGAFSILMLGVPAAALGAVLPLWIRVISDSCDLLGDRVGRLLTWNTMGAVVGVLLTGFVLMPKIGLRGSFTVLALVLCGAGLLVAWAQQKRLMMALASTLTGLLLVVSFTGGDNWRLVVGSGVFRWRETSTPTQSISEIRKNDRILFYEDAADATVSVEQDGESAQGQLILRVNGKVDASTHADLSAQLLMAHLPLMVKPESKDVFVFGMGSGITAGAALAYPIERLTVAENCDPVLRAAKFFEPWNNGVLTNARTRVCREDARTVLKLSPQQYDVIIAEPSNPWTVGIGSVFSRDFYQIATNRLKPGGIMAQWFQLYEMNDGIVNLVVRTFASTFPVVEIWEADRGDIIMLGSDRPWRSDPEMFQHVFGMDVPRRQLASIGLTSPQMILARQFASQRTGFAIPGEGPIQTDEFPILEYQAPKAFYLARRARDLFRFDERTWQADLAPAGKSAALATLEDAELRSVFDDYSSANPDLQAFVRLRYEKMMQSNYERVGGGQSLSCVFVRTNDHALKPPFAAATNEVVRTLYEAELALAADPAKHAQALEQIQKVLAATQPRDLRTAPWSATYYASLATKASLRRGETQLAKKILQRGLELEPDSEVLQYLERVLERDESTPPQPATVAEAALR